MKILIVNKFLYPNGGSETYIFNLGEYLKKQGHDVQFFGMEHSGRCVGNNANVYTSEMDFHNGGLLSKITYSIKTIYNIEARKKIRIVLNDMNPDVVHLNNFTYQLTPSIILEIVKWRKETNRKCKIVFTAHDYNLICPNHMLNNPNTKENCDRCVYGSFISCIKGKCIHGSFIKSVIGALEGFYWRKKGVYQYLDTVICCSEFMKSKMDLVPVFQGKTVTMHNFIDRAEISNTEKKNYVLYFGRLSEEKGIKTLIEACKALPEIPFVIAGNGVLEGYFSDVTNIKYVGFVSGTALEKLIREALFSVYPSEWFENCPFSVMESLIYCTPVLGADIGGIPELINVGVTGYLFESGNVTDLIDKIRRMWYEREKTLEFSDNCKYIDFDDTQKYCDKLLSVYCE